MNVTNGVPADSGKQAVLLAEDEIDLRVYSGIINRSKWSIIGFAFVVCVLATVVSYTLTPIYSATATLLIESEEANIVSIEEVYGIDSSQREYYQTQFEILNSRKLARRVIDRLDIRQHTEYDPTKSRGFNVRDYIPFLPPLEPPTEDQIKQAVTNRFIDNLTILPIRKTQLVNITFESEDADLAPKVANALGNAYINSHLEARLNLTKKASIWLTERLGLMGEDLQQAEEDLRAFQERENLIDVSGVKTLTAQELDEQTRKQVEARKIVGAAKAQLEAAGNASGRYNSAWEALAGVLADTLAQDLKRDFAQADSDFSELQKRYGPKHPQYIAAQSQVASAAVGYQARVRSIVSGFEDQYRSALAGQKEIESELAASKSKIQDINRVSYELSLLQREVSTNRQLYDMFFQRFQETNQTDFAAANARFVDIAERSFDPIKPQKKLIVGLAGVLSIVTGVLIALLRAALDNTIRVAEALEEKLHQSVVGVVPFEEDLGKDSNLAQRYLGLSHSSFSESIRSLRTSVMLSGLEKAHKITVVTSSVPGEGKTTVSSNLALALGQMEKVLLIDSDMRRPSLANVYGLERGTIGLAELVAGTGKAADCIQHLERAGIDLLPAGSVPPNPLDLLSSKRFETLLQQLGERYDRIVIDSAPTQAVSDSLVLSTKADALIYVVKSDSTPASVAKNGIERLLRVGAPIIGCVLNQFDVDAAQKYGYYGDGYYGYGYSSKAYT
jgi:polysaccharide biosynthesis transport protein